MVRGTSPRVETYGEVLAEYELHPGVKVRRSEKT